VATIIKRNNKYCVVYGYVNDDGKRKQKWETFSSIKEAEKRKCEVEKMKNVKTEEYIHIPKCETLNDLLKNYVELYGKEKWALSTYESNLRIIHNYIDPQIGDRKLVDINTYFLEVYYRKLLRTKPVTDKYHRHQNRELVGPATVRDVHKLLRSCFQQAVKWEMMEKNPAINATVPKYKPAERETWDEDTVMHAIEVCENMNLKIAICLSFACTLRIGELLGLTWSSVDISDEALRKEEAFLFVDKELQRINKRAIEDLNAKDVKYVFPESKRNNSTIRILKTPKTESSVRKVYIPNTVALLLREHKQHQEEIIKIIGDCYHDFDLVMATDFGLPIGESYIREQFEKLIEENHLPRIVFHSIRHASVTYKLVLSGGNIKAVQGDSGHAQAGMITDLYAHITDGSRKKLASSMNNSLSWGGMKQSIKGDDAPDVIELPQGVDREILASILANPEVMSLISTIVKNMGK